MASSLFILREAVPDDCAAIVQLIKELAVYEQEPESIVEIDENTLKRDGFGPNRWFRVLVAEAEFDGAAKLIVGYAFYYRTYSTWNGRTIKVEDLYVKVDYRGKGIGTNLLKEVTKIALAEDCVRVHWNVLNWNKAAVDFYKNIETDVLEEWNVCILRKAAMVKLVNTS